MLGGTATLGDTVSASTSPAAVPGARSAASGTPLLIGVLALQGDVREHVAMLEAVGARAVPVRREAELDAVDGLVIPGGESTTMWRLATAFELFEPVRKRIAEGMPAFGSCAGMIMLADRVLDAVAGQETFGGIAMTVRRNAFGRQVDSFEGPIAFDGLDAADGTPVSDDTAEGEPVPARLHGVFIRAPWVEEVDPAVHISARVTAGPGAGRIVAVQHGPLMATSFHPELTGDLRVHGHFVRMARAAR
jgi:pyridoxal 5'-phosphate synthase pdxT subunit